MAARTQQSAWLIVLHGRAPDGHHAIADEFIHRAAVLEHFVGDDFQIQVDGVQGFAGLRVLDFVRARRRR